MALKRKRSSEGVDFSPESVSSFASSRVSLSPSPRNGGMDIDAPISAHAHNSWAWERRSASPWNVNSRTRKRHRDNRPDERTIHESTIDKLYTAQRERPRASPEPSYASSNASTFIKQKSTLHSFWNIQQPPAAPPGKAHHPRGFDVVGLDELRCEDCDTALTIHNEDAMDIDVVDDVMCRTCGRVVCDSCAVHADIRRCLRCAY